MNPTYPSPLHVFHGLSRAGKAVAPDAPGESPQGTPVCCPLPRAITPESTPGAGQGLPEWRKVDLGAASRVVPG